jgi:anti-sigma factor RsiW
MNHQAIQEKLYVYRDPETGDEERREIAAHLEACEGCRLDLARWEQIQARVSQCTPAPSPAFVYQVMDRLEPQPKHAPSAALGFLRWLFPALGYGMALGLMFAVITSRELPVNTEAILLADLPGMDQWTLGNQEPDAGDLVEM